MFLSYADFFQKQLFKKILTEISSVCQTFWIQIRPDILSGLILVLTVCKGYQQMTVRLYIYKLMMLPIVWHEMGDFNWEPIYVMIWFLVRRHCTVCMCNKLHPHCLIAVQP